MSNAYHTFFVSIANGLGALLILFNGNVTLPKIQNQYYLNKKNILNKQKRIFTKQTFVPLLSEKKLIETALCLYKREFKPVYADIICPCPSCYNRPLWNKITYISSQLNKFAIWNDVIKRWEPSNEMQPKNDSFDDFNNVNEIKNRIKQFSLLTMDEIYNTEQRKFSFNYYPGYCDDCPPKTFSPKGKAFIQKYYKNPLNTNNNCSICQIYEPKIAIRAFSNITKRMEIVSSNILATDIFLFELKNDIEYSPIFDILLEIPEHQYENIFECDGKRYMSQKLFYPESSLGGYAKLTEVVSFGTYTGTIDVLYTNIDNVDDKIICSYPWNITFKPLSNPPIINT